LNALRADWEDAVAEFIEIFPKVFSSEEQEEIYRLWEGEMDIIEFLQRHRLEYRNL
jgi:hypothetical protein